MTKQHPIADNKGDLLKHMYHTQRDELAYRRTREFQVFSWSATLLLAIITGLLVATPDRVILLSHNILGRVIVSVVIIGLTYFSIIWQRNQWRFAMANQAALARIAVRLGCFDERIEEGKEPIYPPDWRNWGVRPETNYKLKLEPGKRMATFFLGLIALVTAWIPIFY